MERTLTVMMVVTLSLRLERLGLGHGEGLEDGSETSQSRHDF